MTAKQLRSRLFIGCLAAAAFAQAAERPIDPTFLFRKLADAAARPSDLSSDTCRYRPLFGAGDPVTSIVKGVSRYGVMEIDPRGRSAAVRHPGEERVYFVMEGSGKIQYGGKSYPIKPSDFMYLAPGVEYITENTSAAALRIVVIGYHVPAGSASAAGAALQIRNASEAEKQVLPGHPASTKYLLLMGGKDSKRDLIAAGEVLTSLFIMEFDAGGTNHPHHHMTEEEVYLLLEGDGEMVAGGGMNGIEGRHPATPGDAYFYRPNCTVGFYASAGLGGKKARILAARSTYPGMAKQRP